MKKKLSFLLFSAILMLTSAIIGFGQDCESKSVKLNNGTATLSGKTGSCNKFAFSVEEGQRVKVTITSTDGKANFGLQDGADDETGSKYYSNLKSFNNILTFADFSIEVGGTASTAFTLKVIVTDE
jgi:hypothetical protein